MTPAGKQLAREMRNRFAEMVAGERVETCGLAHAALLIAAEERPFEIDPYLARLDEYGESARERMSERSVAGVEAFNEYMFEELGFAGNQLDYYDPRNSFLNDVMDRRTGIPLTLSIVYLEIGRRAGLMVEGIGLPGHFIVRVRHDPADEAVFVDSFHGRTLDWDDCQDLLDTVYGGQVALTDEHLVPATQREILVRLLTNLKTVYARASLHRSALAAIERILLLSPDAAAEHRDRAVLLAQLERLDEAITEARRYLRTKPADAEQVREHMYTLQKRRAMLN